MLSCWFWHGSKRRSSRRKRRGERPHTTSIVEVCDAATRFRFFSPFPRRWSEVSADPRENIALGATHRPAASGMLVSRNRIFGRLSGCRRLLVNRTFSDDALSYFTERLDATP